MFAVSAIVLVAIPGPNLIYITTRSLGEGRRAGYASALGVEFGTLIHVAAAAAGLSALVASSATAFEAIRYLGAAYLIVLGIRTLRGRDEEPADAAPEPAPLGRVFRQGVVVQLLNPKVALFFLAFLPQFIDPDRGAVAPQILVLGATLATLGLVNDLLYAAAAGALGARLRARGGFARRRRQATGAVYLALGAAAAVTGKR